ncbi:Sensor histidine kinase RcsC [subsurface metagenome]
MYRRLIILSVIILVALCGLTVLGYHAVEKWAEGLEGARLGEFAEVAEQIRQDVKHKLDDFIQTEQERLYTEYQYYYVSEDIVPGQQQMPVLRSPLGGRLEYGLAYGHFQIEPDGNIVTPNDDIIQREGATVRNKKTYAEAELNRYNITNNLLPVLNSVTPGSFTINIDKKAGALLNIRSKAPEQAKFVKSEPQQKIGAKGGKSRSRQGKNYPIGSLQEQQETQYMRQRRSVYEYNISSNAAIPGQQGIPFPQTQINAQSDLEETQAKEQTMEEEPPDDNRQPFAVQANQMAYQAQRPQPQAEQAKEPLMDTFADLQLLPQGNQNETVQIQIEPFVPVVVTNGDSQQSIFGGQVFLLRHVQIEDRHFLQGFQLNEKKLIEEVEESAERFMREGMKIELAQTEDEESAYTAILDFGFGDLLLNLKEIDPAWISNKINWLRNWYFTIIAIVLLAVTLGLTSLWRNARAQIKLAQKKDDFISAVSHELRTPLTSIRMYSEMLEKNWVKSEDKLTEYYSNMHQESERLSRLIENVLDFSRIQRGRKKYTFSLGDINECIANVVEMMTPFAAQSSFSIKMDLEHPAQTVFDGDAVTQIVVNLLDNAIKYARDAEDKTITVRTRSDEQFILIEVEDHGPGVPHRQRKKIFEEFYRSGAEATRETTGTGLGLALVKKFAQAHNGFVEIITAKPTGAIFRVALPLLVAGRGQT